MRRLPVPVLLVCGGLLLGFVPGPAAGRAAARPGARRDPAAAPLLGGVLHRPPRPAPQPAPDLAARVRARRSRRRAASRSSRTPPSPTLSWAGAFTLGAIVSPTDALAATEVARRLNLPRRVVSILEGESLVNDGLALVLYKSAVAAAVAGTFSLWNASWHLVLNVVGGIAVGLAVALRRAAGAKARRRPADRGGDRASLRLPRVPARVGDRRVGRARRGDDRRLHGLVHAGADERARRGSRATRSGRSSSSSSTRCCSRSSGCSCTRSPSRLADHVDADRRGAGDRRRRHRDPARLGADLHLRPALPLPRASASATRTRRGSAPVVIAWAGVRGAVSLAAALALPTDVPQRDVIVFVTFVVILVSLIGPVVTLPALVRADRDRGRRRRRPRGRESADQGGRGCARPHRGDRGGGLGERRLARARARAVPVPHEPLHARG